MAKRKKKPKGWMPYRKKMWINQRYRCGICTKQIRQRYLFTTRVNIDHIRPRAHGGDSFPGNLQLVHMVCNQKKGATCAGCPTCYQTNGNPNGSEA